MIKTIVTWTLTVLPAIPLLLAGSAKLAGAMTEGFRAGGFPDGFVYLIGGIEVFGTLAFLYPRLATWAAVPLVTVMIGAVATHAVHGEFGGMPIPGLIGLMVGVVGWLRRDRMLVPVGASGVLPAR
jgi:putative oxidoreductase